MTPQRIQQRRTKGWRKPEGAVSVARPSKWGNPYTVGSGVTVTEAVALYRDLIERISRDTVEPKLRHDGLGVWDRDIYANIRRDLAGKDLMCWCPLVDAEGNPVPCHADVLLEIANGDPR